MATKVKVGQQLATDLDGLIFDVEAEFSRLPEAKKQQAAELLCAGIRKYRDENYPGKILGYSTFCRIDDRRAHWRFKLLLAIFGKYCDYAMPQAYWKDWHWTPKRTIQEMYSQWGKMEKDWRAAGKADCVKPIIPTGQAYDHRKGVEYIPPSEVSEFLRATKGYQGTNWWRWDFMGPGHWEAIRTAPRIASMKPPYKPVRPTGKEWWLVTAVRWALVAWLVGGLITFLLAKFVWHYKRTDDCVAYGCLWPLIATLRIIANVVTIRHRIHFSG